MAASCCQPVVVPANYDPVFKVDVLHHAPLQERLTSASDIHLDVMVLSFQLDTLCKQSLYTHKPEDKKSSTLRNSQANMVFGNLQQALFKLYKSSKMNSSEIFPRESGLNQLFPRVAAYMAGHDDTLNKHGTTDVDDYLSQLTAMHHVLSMSRQIQNDVTHQVKPKYLAHQLAVLYQGINSIPSGDSTLSRHKSNMEENFPTLKSYLSEIWDHEDGNLSPEVQGWILDLTDNIIEEIRSMPRSMTEELLPISKLFL
ncbi:unnamed protein product [Lymnaea stagnalis]|uniref:Uncharacterized protein n=1 Tax=Lymnaea stagnalis TaxID=6523 RepID=A0AAV2IMH3_LYMST